MTKLSKIGIIGTQCIGKSTLIEDMILQWPQLSKPERTYRDLVKEKKLPVNKDGTKESQGLILDFLVEEARKNYGRKKMVFDRTPLDNLAYSFWLFEKGKSDIDQDFLDKSIIKARNAISEYSVLFYLPLVEKNDVYISPKEQRDVDPLYRAEIDVFFDSFYRAWEARNTQLFNNEDTPPIIPIFGNPIERIQMIALYINEKCEFFGEKDSLITEDIIQQAVISKGLGLDEKTPTKNLPKKR